MLNGQHILYLLKQVDMCDYNPRCYISSGLVFDDIIVNQFRNKAVNPHVEVLDSYFKKTENNKTYMCRGSLSVFY